ncbi:MAG: hypothetical protein R3F61_08550 [Myxococcota bacterium]
MLFFAFAACKGGEGNGVPPGSGLRAVEIPDEWESNEASVVMRLTNAATSSPEVKRAVNAIFNDPEEPVDALDFLMRRPERDPATGEYLPVDTSLSTADLLAGSTLDQLEAYKQKIIDGDRVPYTREETVDTCGNEMIMAIASPHVLQNVFPQGPQSLDIWPDSCPDGADCQTAEFGSWDVGLGEMRFDGFVDMVVNVFPDLNEDPVKPGMWGHFSGFFLNSNNPGTPWISMFASVRRVQVNLLGLWQLDRSYVDPMGAREVFKFPHRARTLNQQDVFVFLEGYAKPEAYWDSEGFGATYPPPYGSGEASPILIDTTSTTGEAVSRQAGTDTTILKTLTDVFTYQIGTAVSCPTVRETAYIRSGPVEFFLCPDIEIGECMAREDMEEAACIYEAEPVFDPFNPFAQVVEFPRVEITAPGQTIVVPEDRLPTYLSAPVDSLSTTVQLTVTPDSVLYMYDPSHITAVQSSTGLPAALPAPIADTHCTESTVQRFDIGTAWAAGTYELTVDFGAGTGVIPDPDITSTGFVLWMYPTSIPTWSSSN